MGGGLLTYDYNRFNWVAGSEAMDRFRLRVREADGYSTDYDSNVKACVTSEFTTAAFRFGHSTVDGKFM